ncbi:MAG: 3-deoxy-8-phosphooctulonate synthase [Flavobacteriales bacterium AspAUS03]
MIHRIPKIKYIDENNFWLIAGPCVVESEKLVLQTAEYILGLSEKYKIPYIFKSSFKKANRSRINSFSGIGDERALKILQKVRVIFDLPVTTDIHIPSDAHRVSTYVDVLQIPAFLVRQTDLLTAAAETKKAITLKKGQFISPETMRFAVQKVQENGNDQVAIIERGTTFGYQDLIVDYRSIPIMKPYAPVILDVTHSLQQPNQSTGVTGGGRADLIETLARAGIAVGIDGIFIETHPDPGQAKSDGANMLQLDRLEELLRKLVILRRTVNVINELQ